MDEVYPGRSVSCCLMQYRGLPPVHEKDLVFCYGLRFYDEEVIKVSEFSKAPGLGVKLAIRLKQ